MTNELHMKRYDNWCEVTHGHQMKEVPEGAGWGEYVRYEDAQAEFTQLRGNLSLAEEGLANYALEVERLQKDRNECLEAFHILFRIFPEPR